MRLGLEAQAHGFRQGGLSDVVTPNDHVKAGLETHLARVGEALVVDDSKILDAHLL